MQFNTSYNKIITDGHYMETIQHGTPQFPFAFYYDNLALFDFHSVEWHWHDELEFIYVEAGTVECWVGEAHFTLTQGCGAFINARVLHRFFAEQECILPNFVCLPAFLAQENSLLYSRFVSPVVASPLDAVTLSPEVPWQAEALAYLREIIALCGALEDNGLLITAWLQRAWQLLFQNARVQPTARRRETEQLCLQQMLQYIHMNYHKPLSLEALCSTVHISKSTALNRFRQVLRTTPIQYLLRYRLQMAARALTASDKTIACIAQECGFSSVDHFCKSFKKHYGTTPTHYRQQR